MPAIAGVGEKEEGIVVGVGRTSRPRSYTLLLIGPLT